jgi:hypothetical protein
MKRFSALIAAFAGFSLFPALTAAGCISDCRDEYDSARQSCLSSYDDPDDADELQMCLRNARDEYEDCVDECRS